MNLIPNLGASISERLEKFKNELILMTNTRYKSYFDSRNDLIDIDKYSYRLWFYVESGIGMVAMKPVGLFGIKNGRNIPVEIREALFNIFFKHFPGDDGLTTSLIRSDIF